MATDNWEQIEHTAGNKAAGQLRTQLRATIGQKFRSRSGQMAKTNVSARYLHGHLDRLVITSPHYSFQKNFGFHEPAEKVKATKRKPIMVRDHYRTGGTFVNARLVHGYARRGGSVRAYQRDIANKETHHIADAINQSNILDTLADSLAESRAVEVVAKIQL